MHQVAESPVGGRIQGRHPYDGAVGPDSSVQEQILSRKPLCVTAPDQMPITARERWPQLNDAWQTYFKESLTGTKYRDEAPIPPTDSIFRTKGLGRQLPVEPITPSKKVLLDPDRRAALLERELREAREAREAQQREREEREAAQNNPPNVCPNCLKGFRQGEVYCQTANCITVLQTKTSPCRGRGCRKDIPYTAAFCRHCGLRQ